jgi:hypothetical protein
LRSDTWRSQFIRKMGFPIMRRCTSKLILFAMVAAVDGRIWASGPEGPPPPNATSEHYSPVKRKPPPRGPAPTLEGLIGTEIIPNPDGTLRRIEVLPGGRLRLPNGTVMNREEFEKRQAEKFAKMSRTLPRAKVTGISDTEPAQPELPKAYVPWQGITIAAAVVVVLAFFWIVARRKGSREPSRQAAV